MVALSLIQLVHRVQIVEHTPECLDGLHHTYLTQVGKEVARGASFWGAGERGGGGGGRGEGRRRRRKRRGKECELNLVGAGIYA